MFGIWECWNNGIMEYWAKNGNVSLNNNIPTFQYSIIPLFLLCVTLKPVKQ
jgi:hypothetical protein